jgi:hypothetical protein
MVAMIGFKIIGSSKIRQASLIIWCNRRVQKIQIRVILVNREVIIRYLADIIIIRI